MSSPSLFIQWGLDIVELLPQAPGQKSFILVVMDYLSKWVEVESYFINKDLDLVQFVYKFIVCQVSLHKSLYRTIYLQFMIFCKEWEISLKYLSPRHIQGNRHDDATKKMILNIMKK